MNSILSVLDHVIQMGAVCLVPMIARQFVMYDYKKTKGIFKFGNFLRTCLICSFFYLAISMFLKKDDMMFFLEVNIVGWIIISFYYYYLPKESEANQSSFGLY